MYSWVESGRPNHLGRSAERPWPLVVSGLELLLLIESCLVLTLTFPLGLGPAVPAMAQASQDIAWSLWSLHLNHGLGTDKEGRWLLYQIRQRGRHRLD